MATLPYFPGTIGEPFTIDLAALGLTPDEISHIDSAVFEALRPSSTADNSSGSTGGGTFGQTFSGGDVTQGKLNYLFLSGDLTVGGFYCWKLVVTIAGGGPSNVVRTFYDEFYIHNPGPIALAALT